MVQPVPKVRKVLLAPLVLLAQPVLKVLKVLKVRKVNKVPQVKVWRKPFPLAELS